MTLVEIHLSYFHLFCASPTVVCACILHSQNFTPLQLSVVQHDGVILPIMIIENGAEMLNDREDDLAVYLDAIDVTPLVFFCAFSFCGKWMWAYVGIYIYVEKRIGCKTCVTGNIRC